MTNAIFPNLELTTTEISVLNSDIESIEAQNTIVKTNGNNIIIKTAEGSNIEVYNMAGILIHRTNALSGTATIQDLAKGIYIIKIADLTTKVIIK